MGVRNWGMVAWLGLAACGGPAEEAVSTAPAAEDSREVEAQACPAGVASRVKIVIPPDPDDYKTLEGLTHVQGTLYFATNDFLPEPSTLWRSNGTEAGTVPVRTFPFGYGELTEPVAVGSRLFFQLYSPATGNELWLSDGTSSGTRLVEDITAGPAGSTLRNPVSLNGRLVFFREGTGTADTELWRSDGTASGTLRVRAVDGTQGLYNRLTLQVGGALLFFRDEATGTRLWRTNGMLAGTEAVLRLSPGQTTIQQVAQAGNLGLFVLQNGPNHQVWKTDGTAQGTVLLEAFGRYVKILGVLGSRVYLASVDAASQQMRIQSLLLSGGGKSSVATLPKYSADDFPFVQNTATSAGSLYFAVGHLGDGPAPDAVELWATDGTSSGTRRLFATLSRGDEVYSPVFATGEGVVLFNGSPTDDLVEPWFTRGTAATTGRLVAPGPGTRIIGGHEFTRMGSRVYFTLYDDTERSQLWSAPASFTCPPGLSEAR
ncbi:hypothetical protein [Corallococcus aberystwythensis]|uniref:Uncharacterized protein n=1 Tax=Corallococcus aberystwythensis TaxID=2316722 RepID=A0A3A8QM13_9BACT|nr:hypothetical protein [Corallococcus aberystwythensis]RKH69809.1 hypothetical protein D7W81_10430 [Corallococcus aberystwythensis]